MKVPMLRHCSNTVKKELVAGIATSGHSLDNVYLKYLLHDLPGQTPGKVGEKQTQ